MKQSILILLLTLGFNATAESLTCTISNPDETASETIEMTKTDELSAAMEYISAGDLSFYTELECYDGACEATVTFDSQIREDEVGQIYIEFDRSAQYNGSIIFQPITNTPDGKIYHFSCEYQN